VILLSFTSALNLKLETGVFSMLYGFSRESEWKWKTSSGGSIGFAFLSGGVGYIVLQRFVPGDDIVLKRPYDVWRFPIRFVGAGLSLNPFKRMPGSAQQSTEDTFSEGVVFLSDSFPREDLTIQDFQGPCLIADASVAFAIGKSWTGIAVGVPSHVFRSFRAVKSPRGNYVPQNDIKAIILTRSFNSGLQFGAGITSSVGYIGFGDLDDMYFDMPASTDDVSIRSDSSEKIELTIKGDVLFNFDDAHFKSEAKKPPQPTHKERIDCINALSAVSKVIERRKPRSVAIWGYTDSFGKEQHNNILSQSRASNMRQWIIGNTSMDPSKILAYGAGATEFVVSPKGTKDQQQSNRRVVIYLFYS